MKTILFKNNNVRILSMAIALIFTASSSFSQSATTPAFAKTNNFFEKKEKDNLYLGVGMGLDYAHLGLRAEYMPLKYIGLQAAVGFSMPSVSYNVGVAIRPLPDRRFQPYARLMYGTNEVLKIKDDGGKLKDSYKSYNGLMAGAGVDIKLGKRNNSLTIGLTHPFYSSKYNKAAADLAAVNKNFEKSKFPMYLSLGFNIKLK